MNCPECGSPLTPGAATCPYCGAPVAGSDDEKTVINYGPAPVGGRPLPPQPKRQGNSATILTIIICATVVIVAIIIGVVTVNINKKEPAEPAPVDTIVVEAPAPAAAAQPAAQPAPARATSQPASKDLSSMPNTSKVNPARVRQVGMTGDFSDIACYYWLTDADVAPLSKSQLRVLRNTIYARHGRRFKSADLRQYFSQFSWYNPYRDEINPGELSKTEQHNITLIKSYE